MYINHRPAFGLDPYEIYNAFQLLKNTTTTDSESELDTNDSSLHRSVFLNELQKRGEHMTDYELADCLSSLLHLNNRVDEMSYDELAVLIDKNIPEKLTVERFLDDLLGIPSHDFDQIIETWEKIRVANSPRLNQSKNLLNNVRVPADSMLSGVSERMSIKK